MANEPGHVVVRCTQCCHVFCKPKLLPCLHTFCETCIFKVREGTEKGKVFSCPVETCKEEVAKGEDDLQDNVLVANIINAKSVACATKGSVKCTSCDNLLEASHRCLDCQRFLCVNCHAAHKHMQIFRRHRMQDISEFFRQQQAQKRPLYCTKHQGETLELFCETSGMLCCTKCVEENTTIPRNNYKSPDEIAVSYRKTLRSSITGLEKKLKSMEGERDRFDRALALLLEKQNRAEAEIVRSASELISKVEEAKQCCLAELSSVVDEKRGLLVETKEDMLQLYCRGEHSCMQARSFLALATDAELLCLMDKFRQRLEELTSYDVQCDLENTLSLYFHSTEVSVETLKDNLGYLQTGSIVPQDVLAAGDGIAMATAGEEEMITIATGCDHMRTMISSICAKVVDPVGVVTPATIHDNFNGTYSMYYTPQLAGPHRLSVKICGHHIRGSPFSVHVTPAANGGTYRHTSFQRSNQTSSLKRTKETAAIPGGRKAEGGSRRWSQEGKKEAINRITKHLGKLDIQHSKTKDPGQSEKLPTDESSLLSVSDPSIQKDRPGAESLAVVKLRSRSEDDLAMVAPLASKTDESMTEGEEVASVSSSFGSPVKSDSDANNNRSANPWVGPRRKVNLDGARSLSRHSSPEKNGTKSCNSDGDEDNEVTNSSSENSKLTNSFPFRKLYSDIEQEEIKANSRKKNVHEIPQPKFQLPSPLITFDGTNNIPVNSESHNAPVINGEVKAVKLEETNCDDFNVSGSEQSSTMSTPVKETTKKSMVNGNVDKTSEHAEKSSEKDAKCKPKFCIDALMPKGKLWKSTSGQLVTKFGNRGVRTGEFSFPIGVAVDSYGGIFVTDTGNNRVQVFDGEGHFKFKFGCIGTRDGEFLRPSAIVVTPAGDIVVKDDKKIQVFDCKGRFVRRFGDNVLRAPFGLALTSQGHLVTVNAPRHDPAAVLTFTLTGDLVQRSLFEPVQGRPNKLRFLAVSQQNLIVSDLGNDTVYMTTLDGKSVLRFGSHGIGDGLLSEPAGVAVDGSGNIVIADSRNCRVQVFKPSGKFFCHVDLEKIVRPSDIALTNDGYLIVVNYTQHNIKKYKLGV
ncbi:tripartite motif-containing protein 3-like isoform X1 [Branchiostoma lanceolatum]|uniref:tripartite motif-containing protein 3-like isoform X1 n=1 Tax=Branchiostoma lanceolatum TaxID=7740 RepID=UPI00345656AB